MLKSIKKSLRNWLLRDELGTIKGSSLIQEDVSLSSDATMTFRIYNGIGGKILEFRNYDRYKDRHENRLYLIHNDQDFGDRVSKIISMEVLKSDN
jgi:hypothetical protein